MAVLCLIVPNEPHKTGLTEYGHRAIVDAYPPVLPDQVRFCCVPLTSFGFLQTLPFTSNALAIRIIFPSVGVMQLSCELAGLPASPGKQKRKQTRPFLLTG